jgi:thiol-disulfide isomerase/thioredoxin
MSIVSRWFGARLVVIVGAAVALAAVSFYAGGLIGRSLFHQSALTSTIRLVRNGQPVPLVAAEALDGRIISSADWRGRVTIVNFWATWCGPCREETADFIALQRRYPDEVRIVGFSVDEDAPDLVRRWVAERGVNYPVAMAGAELQARFGGIEAVPTSFVIDREGRIVQRHVGLYPPQVYDLEVRALAGLSVRAKVEWLDDPDAFRLGDHADLTRIPGVNLAGLSPAVRAAVLQRLNTEVCPCGCGLSIARCRRTDPTCDVSLPIAREIVRRLADGAATP